MINLAPNHKQGLLLNNPVMLAGGTVGYGEAMHRGVEPPKLGAVVVGPILRHSHAGPTPPRLAETVGGMVLDAGLQNRGVSAVLKKFAKGWAKLGCPIIAQVADSDVDMMGEVVQRLNDATVGYNRQPAVELRAIELLAAPTMDDGQLRGLLRTVSIDSDLPLLLKVPLERAAPLAVVAAEFGVSSLVVGRPMRGAGAPTRRGQDGAASGSALVAGDLFGPLAFAPMMAALQQVLALDLPCTVVACGGIHTVAQARQALDAGASAVQIDSAVWVEPGLPARIAGELGALQDQEEKAEPL